MLQKTELSNKLRVVTKELKDRSGVAVGIWAGTGGRFEEARAKGVAHFLEHIVFKGSRNYSCKEIKELIEGVGGALNAFTSEEQTCYYAKTPTRHLRNTFDILADMVFYPQINPKDVEKERTVILEEIKMYHDIPQYYVGELLDELIWPNHPLGKSLAGSPETVSKLSIKDLRGFQEWFYRPNNIVISACGNVQHEPFVRMVKAALGRLSGRADIECVAPETDQTKPGLNLFYKDVEQMHVALGTHALPTNHPDLYALALMNIILGGNMSSRLFNEVREKRGLAYSISSGVKSLADTGIFTVRAGVDNQKIGSALELVLKMLRKLKKEGVTADELTRAKDYFLGQFLLALEDTQDHMLWIGETEISQDEVNTFEKVIAKVKKVTLADIRRVAQTIFNEQQFNLAVVGPVTDRQKKDLGALMGV